MRSVSIRASDSIPSEADLLLDPEDWLATMRSEYLAGFVSGGGAAIRVGVLPSPDLGPELTRRLLSVAEEHGFVSAAVDAATCKVHLLQNLFHAVARQVNWEGLAHHFVRGELLRAGHALPGDGSLDVEAVARASEQDVTIVRQDASLALTRELMRDPGLSRQFRLAALALCKAELEPDELRRELAGYVRDWLHGDLARLGSLRQAFIYQKVARHNARTMLLSTSAFIRKAGRRGLVVVVDVSRYPIARPADDGGNRYSKAAALDMWETLRQFVDGIDDMPGCFFLFLVGPEFTEDHERGLRSYSALHLRLTDDVRDRRHANPLAPMVRFAVPAW